MQNWIILEQPGLLLLYALGYGCGIIDKRQQASRGWLTWLGCALVVAASAFLILAGASLWETAAWLTGFLLVIMGVKE